MVPCCLVRACFALLPLPHCAWGESSNLCATVLDYLPAHEIRALTHFHLWKQAHKFFSWFFCPSAAGDTRGSNEVIGRVQELEQQLAQRLLQISSSSNSSSGSYRNSISNSNISSSSSSISTRRSNRSAVGPGPSDGFWSSGPHPSHLNLNPQTLPPSQPRSSSATSAHSGGSPSKLPLRCEGH